MKLHSIEDTSVSLPLSWSDACLNVAYAATALPNGHQRWNVWVQVPEVSENMVVPIMQMLPLSLQIPRFVGLALEE